MTATERDRGREQDLLPGLDRVERVAVHAAPVEERHDDVVQGEAEDEEEERHLRPAEDAHDARGEQDAVDDECRGGHRRVEPQEAVAAEAVSGGAFVRGDDPETGAGERVVDFTGGEAVAAEGGTLVGPPGEPDKGTADATPHATEQAAEHGHLDERLTAGSEHTAELEEVRADNPGRGQVLEDEVADEGVGASVRDALEPVARHGEELDVQRRHVGPCLLEHRR